MPEPRTRILVYRTGTVSWVLGTCLLSRYRAKTVFLYVTSIGPGRGHSNVDIPLSRDILCHVCAGRSGGAIFSFCTSSGHDGQVNTFLWASSAERCCYSYVRSFSWQLGHTSILERLSVIIDQCNGRCPVHVPRTLVINMRATTITRATNAGCLPSMLSLSL